MAASVSSSDRSLQNAYSALEKQTNDLKKFGFDDDYLSHDPLSNFYKLGIKFKEEGKEAAIEFFTSLPDRSKREGMCVTILFNFIKNDKIKQDCDLTVKLEF
jgi:hypothetical protein